MTLTEEQLYADLEKDGVPENLITKAKNGDGDAMFDIGEIYLNKQKHDKATAWYLLSADKNNSEAQNTIGNLYYTGAGGLSQDYLLAMKWFLKSAVQNYKDKDASYYIGVLFECGYGVPVNKYKALEWYTKNGEDSLGFDRLTDQGFKLTQQDKDKPIEQLARETEELAWPGIRFNIEKQLIEENKILREENNSLEQLVKKLQEELRASGSKK